MGIFEPFFNADNAANGYGGERVRVKMSDKTFKLGTIQDKMAGKHGYIGILFNDGTFEFMEDYDVNVIEYELKELEEICAKVIRIVYNMVGGYQPVTITRNDAYTWRKRAFELAKSAGWTTMHNVIIPELTKIIKGT